MPGLKRWIARHNLEIQEAVALMPSFRRLVQLRVWFLRRMLKECGPGLDISQHAILKFPERLSLGANVFFNRGVFVTARAPISIGDNTSVGSYTIINSGDHRYQDRTTPVRTQGHELRPIVIEEDVWIGSHAVILKGVRLGRGCVVAAGAVVAADVPPFTVVGGVPARPIAMRGDDVTAGS
jgi:acetyltransferase-like isoleucine patch superfamily enzyme